MIKITHCQLLRGESIKLWGCVAASGTLNIAQVNRIMDSLNISKFWKQIWHSCSEETEAEKHTLKP